MPDSFTCSSPGCVHLHCKEELISHSQYLFYPHTCVDYRQAISSDAPDHCTQAGTFSSANLTELEREESVRLNIFPQADLIEGI